ncbi:hypothetical protein DCF83_17760 (plasmid) [Edwardsiella tarda]|uniref:hypothetical protein n=1 Tax=Edwardsiella tarda TaxID=636 RepID=UPI000D5226EC|nr:hypothetical protein [Edwardsiella tarda]UCQ29577.1 hypothetical protein DCF83_17760 [Edwardsiella tarda]
MKITKSMVEQDAAFIFNSLRDTDYVIPDGWTVAKPALKIMGFIALYQCVMNLVDIAIWGGLKDTSYWFAIFLYSLGPMAFIAFIVYISTFSTSTFYACLSDEVKKKSLLINLCRQKIRFWLAVSFFMNVGLSIILLIMGSGFVLGQGAGWFFMILVSGFTISTSMNRYLTPKAVEAMNKVNDILSPSKSAN